MDNLNSHHPDMETNLNSHHPDMDNLNSHLQVMGNPNPDMDNLNSHHPDMDNLNSRGVTARAAQCREGEASTTVAHSR